MPTTDIYYADDSAGQALSREWSADARGLLSASMTYLLPPNDNAIQMPEPGSLWRRDLGNMPVSVGPFLSSVSGSKRGPFNVATYTLTGISKQAFVSSVSNSVVKFNGSAVTETDRETGEQTVETFSFSARLPLITIQTVVASSDYNPGTAEGRLRGGVEPRVGKNYVHLSAPGFASLFLVSIYNVENQKAFNYASKRWAIETSEDVNNDGNISQITISCQLTINI